MNRHSTGHYYVQRLSGGKSIEKLLEDKNKLQRQLKATRQNNAIYKKAVNDLTSKNRELDGRLREIKADTSNHQLLYEKCKKDLDRARTTTTTTTTTMTTTTTTSPFGPTGCEVQDSVLLAAMENCWKQFALQGQSRKMFRNCFKVFKHKSSRVTHCFIQAKTGIHWGWNEKYAECWQSCRFPQNRSNWFSNGPKCMVECYHEQRCNKAEITTTLLTTTSTTTSTIITTTYYSDPFGVAG